MRVAPAGLLAPRAELAIVRLLGRVHLPIERGEEQVLQDGFVVSAPTGIGVIENLL